MTKQVLAKKPAGAGSGELPTENSGASVGVSVKRVGNPGDISVSVAKSLDDMPTLSSDGEPKSVLLALIWSPLETLLANGDARIFVGKDAVAVFLHKTALSQHNGLVPADEVLAEL